MLDLYKTCVSIMTQRKKAAVILVPTFVWNKPLVLRDMNYYVLFIKIHDSGLSKLH